MKKITLFTLVILLTSGLYAQHEEEFKTVFKRGEENLQISGFGGPSMSFGTIDGAFAHMMGGGGGVMVNNFFLGGYGMGLTTPPDFKEFSQGYTSEKLSFGHGGFWTGFILWPRRALHLSFSSQFGWGKIGTVDNIVEEGDLIFVISPIAEVELNFSRFFKLGVGSSISLVNGIDTLSAYRKEDFLNPSVFLSFKFGWFD